MKKLVLVAAIAILIMAFAASSSMAASENSISINGGYSHTWVELEYEMKNDPFAYGAKVGIGSAFEIGGFFRYYYGLNSALNIPAEYRLSVFGGITPSFLLGVWSPGVGFGLKIGPGVDFRWKQLRVYIEGGYRFDTLWAPPVHHGGFATAGIGYIF